MSNPPNPHQHQRTPSSSALMSLVTTASSYLTHRRAASYDKNMTSSTITTATATSTASTSTSTTVTSTSIATSTSNESVPSNMTGSSLEKGGALTNVANKTTLQSNNNNNTTNYNISTNNSSKSSGNSSSNSNNSNNQNSNSSNTSTHTSSHSQSHSHHLNSNQPPQILFKGTLYKWTNYITGWQPRFFVIQGHPDWSISYYMNEDQYAKSGPSAIRSFLPLIDVIITVASDSVTDFSVYNKSEAYYLKANDKSERKQWVLALGSAKSQQAMLLARKAETVELDERKRRIENLEKLVSQTRIHEETTRKQLANVHTAISMLIMEAKKRSEEESINDQHNNNNNNSHSHSNSNSSEKRKTTKDTLNERAMILKATLRATMDNLAECVDSVDEQEEIWERSVDYEKRQQLKAEQSLRVIRSQQEALEKLLEQAQAENS